MKFDQNCVVCKKPFLDDAPTFSIFQRDPSSGKCLAYKLSQICGFEFISEEHGTFACAPCHDLLNTIYFLEEDVFKKFKAFAKNPEIQDNENIAEIETKIEINDEERVFGNPSSELIGELSEDEKIELVHESNLIIPDQKEPEDTFCSENLSMIENHDIKNLLTHSDNPNISTNEPQSYEERRTQFSCEICKDFFKTNENLKGHMKIHYGDKRHTCQDCGEKFFTSSNLKQHRRRHTGEKMCWNCNTVFQNKEGIEEHRKQESYDCNHCEKSFSKCKELPKHKKSCKISSISKVIECKICNKVFKERRTLLNHRYEVHYGGQSLVCEDCGKYFPRRLSLKEHRAVHHSSNGRSFKCNLCERSYFLKGHLRDHMKKGHPTSLDHGCEECGKMFPTNSILNSHKMHVHKKTPCQNCGKSYNKFHMVKHKCKGLKQNVVKVP